MQLFVNDDDDEAIEIIESARTKVYPKMVPLNLKERNKLGCQIHVIPQQEL